MLRRPLLLKLFALFLFIDPILRVLFISMEREFPVLTVIQKTFELGAFDFFNFWFLFPISGFLVLSVKMYSYLFFIGIQFYSLYFHLNYEPYSWPYLSVAPSVTAYLLLAINLFIVIYLMLPRSRFRSSQSSPNKTPSQSISFMVLASLYITNHGGMEYGLGL